MRILFLSDNYPPETNAAASRVHERAAYWVRWGHDVTVLTSTPNFPEGKVYPGYRNRWLQRETIEGVKVVRVKTLVMPNRGVKLRILDFLSYMVSAFSIGLFLRRPELIVATSPQFFCAVAGKALAKVKRVPFVFELSDLWPASIRAVGAIRNERLLRAVEKLELRLYRGSKAVVALTHAFKEDLASRGIEPGKIAVIPNGVDLNRAQGCAYDPVLARELGLENKFVVGYIGTHGMAHALESAVEAAKRLEHDDRVRFLFVGSGGKAETVRRRAADLNLTNVVFLPAQPKSKIGAYWQLLDVALVHLKNDPVFSTVLPSKIFEAMMHGLPILYAGPRGEAEELVLREGAGMAVPAEDPEALSRATALLLEDPILRARFAEASHKASPHHSRETQAKNMLAVLESVVRHEATIPFADSEAFRRPESALQRSRLH